MNSETRAALNLSFYYVNCCYSAVISRKSNEYGLNRDRELDTDFHSAAIEHNTLLCNCSSSICTVLGPDKGWDLIRFPDCTNSCNQASCPYEVEGHVYIAMSLEKLFSAETKLPVFTEAHKLQK